jgi:hypothetical protein
MAIDLRKYDEVALSNMDREVRWLSLPEGDERSLCNMLEACRQFRRRYIQALETAEELRVFAVTNEQKGDYDRIREITEKLVEMREEIF